MLIEALIYLVAAVISVPVAKRLGLGSVLGYLLAGIIIGPSALKLVGEQTDVMHFAEFGVVMMLFLIGLELQPRKLWELRHSILGLGGSQVLITATLVIGVLTVVSELQWQTIVAIGLAIALSSTAIVLQTLNEKGWMQSQAGTSAFSVLLFQDIAVIPILALLPFLALSSSSDGGHGHSMSLIGHFPTWIQISISCAAIAAIIFAGKYLSRPLFRFIAESHIREIFTASALMIVIAIAALMQAIGLSPALGTFLAGVVLAENEFRHELEIDIEPFKGLLLGLFFITVGASINFDLVIAEPLLITLSVISLILIKMVVLFGLAKVFKLGGKDTLLFSFSLAQGGEFAFVIVSSSKPFGIFPQAVSDTLIVVVALSMLVSPLLFVLYEFIMKSGNTDNPSSPSFDNIEPRGNVIIAGYGRFGQVVGRLLHAQGYDLTILEHSPSQIDLVRRFGNKVFYGDASRVDLLKAAGAKDAKLLVIAIDEPDTTLDMIHLVKKHYPDLKVLARATDRRHAYALMNENIEGFRRETFDSAFNLGVDALKVLGMGHDDAEKAGKVFYEHDTNTLKILQQMWGDDKSYGVAIRQREEDLRQVLSADNHSEKH